MKINWFPGHMKKAIDTIGEEIKLVDVVIYVLDSRAPFSCLNPSIEKYAMKRPIIYVLNKCDLADKSITDSWQSYFNKKSKCIKLDSRVNSSTKIIVPILKEILKSKIEKNKLKGIFTTIRAMVVGVPNTGKSTLINSIGVKAKTVTGNRPGVTRSKQWVKVADNIELLDTPGTLWPNLENQKTAHYLSYIGSIKDEVLDINELAFDFIADMIKINKLALENRYNIVINDDDETIAVFDKICKSRGFVLRGNEIDYDRGAVGILDDFRKGRMGGISLETPQIFDRLMNEED